jgi:phage repressor protein C with HTH and peptisase S24 domain
MYTAAYFSFDPLAHNLPRMKIAAKVQRIMDANGWTQVRLAEELGVSQPTVNRWLGGADPRGETRDRLNGLFDKAQADKPLVEGTVPPESSLASEPAPAPGVAYPRYPSNASPPVPVTFKNETIGMFGQAVGGEDGRFVLNGSRVMDVHCPPTLIGVKDAYGVFVHGGSMRPRYREGEAVFVNPHLPVRQDDYAVVQIKGDFEGDDIGGFIKQFISMNAKELVLAQHQRPETFPVEEASEGRYLLRFPRSKVAAVHRIVWAGEV